MGAKYVPSVKDQKANRRFQQQQHTTSKFIRLEAKPPAPKASAAKKKAK